jgi:hypothetical protein
MPQKKRPSSAELSRLKVLAAGDERAFAAHAAELLRSGDRLAREAALEALLERPLPALREPLHDLYFELDADGLKRDQGATLRTSIVRILGEISDVRDRDLAIRAASAFESVYADDLSWTLRVHGLRLLADLDPALFPYYAVEHLDDNTGVAGEPANTVLQLLAGTGNHVPIYQWLIGGEHAPALVPVAFGTRGPPQRRRARDGACGSHRQPGAGGKLRCACHVDGGEAVRRAVQLPRRPARRHEPARAARRFGARVAPRPAPPHHCRGAPHPYDAGAGRDPRTLGIRRRAVDERTPP